MSTMREEVYHMMYPLLKSLVDVACDHIEQIEDGNEEINIDRVIRVLDRFKADCPDQKIIVETPNGSVVDLKIGEAFIYEGNNGELVIDAE